MFFQQSQRGRRHRIAMTVTTVVGVVAIVAGVGLEIATNASIADNLVTIGVLLVLYVTAIRKGRSIEEAYNFGYDLGYEMGWRERDTQADQAPPPPKHYERSHRR